MGAHLAKPPAQRMAESRARKRGDLPPVRTCSICQKMLKPTGKGKAYEAGLCFRHWAETPEGKEDLRIQRSMRRLRKSSATPFRYFGSLPEQDAFPEGPFNRMRLAISSTYTGKGQPRGTLFIVWSDDVVTAHYNIRQADVGSIAREDGEEVDRSDLALMAHQTPALTERIRHYGHGDIYLV